MRLFGCSHTHFGMGSTYYFSYLLSKAILLYPIETTQFSSSKESSEFIICTRVEPQNRGSAGIGLRARKLPRPTCYVCVKSNTVRLYSQSYAKFHLAHVQAQVVTNHSCMYVPIRVWLIPTMPCVLMCAY